MALFYAATFWLGRWAARRSETGSFHDMVAFGLRFAIGEPLLGLPRLLPLAIDAAGLATLPVKTLIMVAALATMWTGSRMTARQCQPEPLSVTQPI